MSRRIPIVTRLALTTALAVVVSLALAQSPVGAWKGVMRMEVPKGVTIPKEHKAQVERAKAAFAKAKLTLVFKADKTYESTIKNGPDGKDHVASGTWNQTGLTITLNPLKRDGKVATGEGAKDQVLAISKDGKKLRRNLQQGVVAEYSKG